MCMAEHGFFDKDSKLSKKLCKPLSLSIELHCSTHESPFLYTLVKMSVCFSARDSRFPG